MRPPPGIKLMGVDEYLNRNKTHDKQKTVDRVKLANDFPSRYSFYGLHRFISERERDEIIAALRRPVLEAVSATLPNARELLTEARNVIEQEAQIMYDSHVGTDGEWDDDSDAEDEFRSYGELVKRIDTVLGYVNSPSQKKA